MPNAERGLVSQSAYQQIPKYSAYGYTKMLLPTTNPLEILNLPIEELNQYLPIIRFDRNHYGYNKAGYVRPAGMGKVSYLHWHEPKDKVGRYPYVRIRDLQYRQVGNTNTLRVRMGLDELLIVMGLADREFFQKNVLKKRGPKKDRAIVLEKSVRQSALDEYEERKAFEETMILSDQKDEDMNT